VLQILICRQQRVEVGGRQLQQFTVSLAGPSHLSDCADLVVRQQAGKRPRQRFIEQEAHRQSGDLWLAREPRLPVHALRSESRRGTDPACPQRPDNQGGSSPARVCLGKPEFPPGFRGRRARRYPRLASRLCYTGTREPRCTPSNRQASHLDAGPAHYAICPSLLADSGARVSLRDVWTMMRVMEARREMRSAPVGFGKVPVVVARDPRSSVGIAIPAAHGKGGLDAVLPRGSSPLASQSLVDTAADGLRHGDSQAARPPAELAVLLIRELYLGTHHDVSLLTSPRGASRLFAPCAACRVGADRPAGSPRAPVVLSCAIESRRAPAATEGLSARPRAAAWRRSCAERGKRGRGGR
jgi:hypothetical protein